MIEFITANTLLLVAGVLVFLAIVMISTSVGSLLEGRSVLVRRLELSGQGDERGERLALEDNVLGSLARFVTPRNLKDLSKIRQRLVRAGYRRPSAVRIYYLSKAALGVGLALLSAVVLVLLGSGLSASVVGLLNLMFMLVGYFIPSFWVERRIQYRRQEAELGFPDVLDLILVCIDAGNGIDQATRRVVKEIEKVNPVLADEFGVANDELRAGKERAAVFRDFADRVDVPDIRAFATVLRQSDEFGVSIADTLRVYASEMRNKRIMRAETKANLMPLQLALGTMLFTVPPTMLIMGGPSVLAITRAFSGMGQ